MSCTKVAPFDFFTESVSNFYNKYLQHSRARTVHAESKSTMPCKKTQSGTIKVS